MFSAWKSAQDDTPVIFSVDHPWALPLLVQQDTPKALCCFRVQDLDLRSAPQCLGREKKRPENWASWDEIWREFTKKNIEFIDIYDIYMGLYWF